MDYREKYLDLSFKVFLKNYFMPLLLSMTIFKRNASRKKAIQVFCFHLSQTKFENASMDFSKRNFPSNKWASSNKNN